MSDAHFTAYVIAENFYFVGKIGLRIEEFNLRDSIKWLTELNNMTYL